MKHTLEELEKRIEHIQEEINSMQDYLNKLRLYILASNMSQGKTAQRKDN